MAGPQAARWSGDKPAAEGEEDAELFPDQYDVAPFWLQVDPLETSLRSFTMLTDGRMIDVAIQLNKKLVRENLGARPGSSRRWEIDRLGDYEIQYAGGGSPIWYWLFDKKRTLADLLAILSPALDDGQQAAAGEGAGEQ